MELDAAQPHASLGDLGSVVPTRGGFGAPAVETPPQASADPFQWSGPKFGQKAAPAAESPPFGASVLKSAPQTHATMTPGTMTPAPLAPAAPIAAEPEPAELSRYEVIAAMPAPAAQPAAASFAQSVAPQVAPRSEAVPQSPKVETSEARAKPALAQAVPAAAAPSVAPPSPAMPSPIVQAPKSAVDAMPVATMAPMMSPVMNPVLPGAPAVTAASGMPLASEALAPLDTGDIGETSEAGFEAAAIESTAAAASALGALAAGLAASSKSMMPPLSVSPGSAPVAAVEPVLPKPVPAVEVIPAVVVTAQPVKTTDVLPSMAAAPVSMPQPSAPSVTVVSASPAAATVASAVAEPAPVRSLDDTVADLLRPMLRQWLSENMPRIVEKALRIEVAESVRGIVPPPKSE